MEKITYHHQVWRKGFQNAKEGFEISGKYSHLNPATNLKYHVLTMTQMI